MGNVFQDIPPDFDKNFLEGVARLTLHEVQKAAALLIKGPWVEVTINPPTVGQETLPEVK
jgi:predicted Zn-dependent peptidase